MFSARRDVFTAAEIVEKAATDLKEAAKQSAIEAKARKKQQSMHKKDTITALQATEKAVEARALAEKLKLRVSRANAAKEKTKAIKGAVLMPVTLKDAEAMAAEAKAEANAEVTNIEALKTEVRKY